MKVTCRGIPFAPGLQLLFASRWFAAVELQKRMPGQCAHRLAQRDRRVFVQRGEKLRERSPAIKEMENRGGERIGGDAPLGQKILKKKLMATPVADYKRSATIEERVPDLFFHACERASARWRAAARSRGVSQGCRSRARMEGMTHGLAGASGAQHLLAILEVLELQNDGLAIRDGNARADGMQGLGRFVDLLGNGRERYGQLSSGHVCLQKGQSSCSEKRMTSISCFVRFFVRRAECSQGGIRRQQLLPDAGAVRGAVTRSGRAHAGVPRARSSAPANSRTRGLHARIQSGDGRRGSPSFRFVPGRLGPATPAFPAFSPCRRRAWPNRTVRCIFRPGHEGTLRESPAPRGSSPRARKRCPVRLLSPERPEKERPSCETPRWPDRIVFSAGRPARGIRAPRRNPGRAAKYFFLPQWPGHCRRPGSNTSRRWR